MKGLWYWLLAVHLIAVAPLRSVLTTSPNSPPVLTPLSALSPLHYSEVIYNACGVMIPWYTSRVIIKQASSRGLWPLHVPPPCHPPHTEHENKRGREDCVYIAREGRGDQKEERERAIGSIERRFFFFFPPVAQERFHWKAVAVYRSALRDGNCEAKNGEKERERER